jgi:diguanylate cyclase (GGDEF)-like protein
MDSRARDMPSLGTGLRGRITGVVLLTALCTALVVGAAAIYSVYAPLQERTQQMYSRVLAGSADEVDGFLETARIEIDSIAGEPQLRHAILAAAARPEPGDAQDPRLVDALKGALSRSPDFAGFIALDRQGETLAVVGAGPPLVGLLRALQSKNVIDSELLALMQTSQLRKELGGIAAPIIRSIDTDLAVHVAIAASPVRDGSDQLAATLIGPIRQRVMGERLRGELLGERANIFLVDEFGALVAAHQDSDAPISEGAGRASSCSLQLNWSGDRGGVATCALTLGKYGWGLVVEQPIAEAFGPLVVMLSTVLLSGAVMVVVFTLLAVRLAAVTLKPVRELYHAAVSVGRGDFSAQISQEQASGEMQSLIAAFNHMVRRLGERSRQFEDGQRALESSNRSFQDKYQSISELSITDPLTQLPNRRYFDTQLECEVKRLSRKGGNLCLLVLDVDDFKKINDTFGHAAGDVFLKQIAAILKEIVRATDLVARFGGEEFVVVTTSAGIAGAMVLAEKLRTAVAEASFIVDETRVPRRATISIGVAGYKGSQTGLFNAADAALYRAKADGKNCVVADDN